MAGIGSPMLAPLPVPTITPGPTWASDLITFLQEVQTDIEGLVTNAGLNLSSVPEASHGDRITSYGAATGQTQGATWLGSTSQYWVGAAGSDTVTYDIVLPVGERIKSVTYTGRANGALAWTGQLYKMTLASGTVVQISTTSTSGIAGTIERLTLSGLTETVASGVYYFCLWTAGGVAARSYGAEVLSDRP